MLIRYAGQQQTIRVSLIHAWDRGDIIEPIMSASSGPKDCVRNWIFDLFDRHPDIERVEMVRGIFKQSEPFAIRRKADGWYDCQDRRLEVEK